MLWSKMTFLYGLKMDCQKSHIEENLTLWITNVQPNVRFKCSFVCSLRSHHSFPKFGDVPKHLRSEYLKIVWRAVLYRLCNVLHFVDCSTTGPKRCVLMPLMIQQHNNQHAELADSLTDEISLTTAGISGWLASASKVGQFNLVGMQYFV